MSTRSVSLIQEVSPFQGDDEDLFSLGTFMEALREEREEACKAQNVVDTGPWSFDETVSKLRQEEGPINWMLCAIP